MTIILGKHILTFWFYWEGTIFSKPPYMDTCHLRIENKTLQQHIYETLGNGREYIKLSVDRNYVTTLFSNSNVPQTQQ